MTCSRSLREDMVNPGPKPSSILQDSPGASGWRLGAFQLSGLLAVARSQGGASRVEGAVSSLGLAGLAGSV